MTSIDPQASATLPTSTDPTTILSADPDTATSTKVIHVGTRKSELARAQTDIVVAELKKKWPNREYQVHAISTMGDKNQVTALHDFGAKSLWTFELEAMLLQGEVDFVVHSLKDIPTQIPEHTTLGAILSREDARDALCFSPNLPHTSTTVAHTLSNLPTGSVIGTSSVRRSAQLARLFPHLTFQSVRGNLGTRLSKLDAPDSPFAAIILAAAGLIRINLGHRISAFLTSKGAEIATAAPQNDKSHAGGIAAATPTTAAQPLTPTKGSVASAVALSAERPSANRTASSAATDNKDWQGMLHAVGQGAIGVQIRDGDTWVQELLAPIVCRKTTLACLAERSLLRTLEGGCSVPIGVETEWTDARGAVVPAADPDAAAVPLAELSLTMRAIVVSLDGTEAAKATLTRKVLDEGEADQFGWEAAQLLVQEGADKILEKITLNRAIIEKQGDGA